MNYVQLSSWNAENAVYEGSFTFYCACATGNIPFIWKREGSYTRTCCKYCHYNSGNYWHSDILPNMKIAHNNRQCLPSRVRSKSRNFKIFKYVICFVRVWILVFGFENQTYRLFAGSSNFRKSSYLKLHPNYFLPHSHTSSICDWASGRVVK
jgi:hypothetical protein